MISFGSRRSGVGRETLLAVGGAVHPGGRAGEASRAAASSALSGLAKQRRQVSPGLFGAGMVGAEGSFARGGQLPERRLGLAGEPLTLEHNAMMTQSVEGAGMLGAEQLALDGQSLARQ